jgi:drug/metabolite transporter (DMT)-like permease
MPAATSTATPHSAPARRALVGALLCAGSAAAFGAMAIFGKLAYEAGVTVITVLVVRFVLAAGILGAIGARRRPRSLPRGKLLLAALALGGIGYAAQAGLYFTALTRIDAGVVALLLYTFPAFVTLGAVALGRDRLDRVRIASLAIAFAGLFLVLFVDTPTDLDALGVAAALAAAAVYTVYILASETVLERTEPLTLAACVCAGGAITYTLVGLVSGRADFGFEPIGWLWLAGIVLVSTVLAIALFFAGLGMVGPSRASIISTVEPLVTVVLAMIVFGERLAATQLAGGALVLASVVLLQTLGGDPEPPGP